jgi:hypothetical protein
MFHKFISLKLRTIVMDETPYGAITIDCWTAQHSSDRYMSVTFHYITSEWEMKRYELCTGSIDFFQCLLRFGAYTRCSHKSESGNSCESKLLCRISFNNLCRLLLTHTATKMMVSK